MRVAAFELGCVLLFSAAGCVAQGADLMVRGRPLPVSPEALSGVWVASDGKGGWLELRVSVSATVPLGGSLVDGPFLLQRIDVGLCSGPSPTMRFGQCNYVADDAESNLRFGRDSIRVSGAPRFDFPGAVVDLRREGDRWTGVMRRGSSIAREPLHRGDARGLSGAWRSGRGECLHLGETASGLVAWFDQMQDPAKMRFAPRVKPSPAFEQFGLVAGAARHAEGFLSLEVGGVDEGSAGAGGRTIYIRPRTRQLNGRSETVLAGMRSSDGRWVEPDWVRTPGESCRGVK